MFEFIGQIIAGETKALIGLALILILFIVAIALFVFMGALAFIGMVFLLVAVYVIFINQGNLGARFSLVIMMLIIGFTLISLSYLAGAIGMNIYNPTLDFSGWPGVVQLHEILTGNPVVANPPSDGGCSCGG